MEVSLSAADHIHAIIYSQAPSLMGPPGLYQGSGVPSCISP